jgi:hypothetical protein
MSLLMVRLLDMTDVLAMELETYEQHRSELLANAENKFVLIHGEEVKGTFDTESDAVTQGFESYGNVPFLVKRVVRVEHPETFVSNLIAI